MKISKGILVLALAIVSLVSCKKDDVVVDNGLVGTWEGEWGFDEEDPDVYERWEIKKNGELLAYDGSGDLIAKGTCNVNGLNFEGEYKSEYDDNEYSLTGLYHDVLKEIVGTWGHDGSTTNGGNFEMYKK